MLKVEGFRFRLQAPRFRDFCVGLRIKRWCMRFSCGAVGLGLARAHELRSMARARDPATFLRYDSGRCMCLQEVLWAMGEYPGASASRKLEFP